MKKTIFLLAIVFVAIVACSKDYLDGNSQNDTNIVAELENKIIDFEANYIINHSQTRTTDVKYTKLIGYTTVAYHNEDSIAVNYLWEKYKKEIEANGSFLTLDGKMRVYYPMREAIVEYQGQIYTADSLGQIPYIPLERMDEIKVIGRAKTALTIETKFANKFEASKMYRNDGTLIFDMGIKKCHKEGFKKVTTRAEQEISGGNVSCTQNHYPYTNCTRAFNVAVGRCVTKDDRCMDYNGFGTDCLGSKLYFVGSDCSVAMAQGHCWNEIM